MKMEKILYIVRGLPSSGKSTFAKTLGGVHYEADMYFMKDGKYNFDPNKLKLAHNWCMIQTQKSMVDDEPRIVVSNTFTQEWEMDGYFKLAEENNYQVFTVIVEKRHSNNNDHNVPQEKVEQMRKRFEIKL